VALCFVIRRHYQTVPNKLMTLYAQLENVPRTAQVLPGESDPAQPTRSTRPKSFAIK